LNKYGIALSVLITLMDNNNDIVYLQTNMYNIYIVIFVLKSAQFRDVGHFIHSFARSIILSFTRFLVHSSNRSLVHSLSLNYSYSHSEIRNISIVYLESTKSSLGKNSRTVSRKKNDFRSDFLEHSLKSHLHIAVSWRGHDTRASSELSNFIIASL